MNREIAIIATAFILQGCIATTGSNSTLVGPGSSSDILAAAEKEYSELASGRQRLQKEIEVIVPAFDPNIPADPNTWEKKGIWPELRRAEANHFAIKMKEALEDTNQFGAVRVAPNREATGDVYILGRIEESNGENVRFNIQVIGIDGKQWLNRTFEHQVKEHFFNSIRNKGKDPYDPAFEKAAEEIALEMSRHDDEYLRRLNLLTEMRFGYSFSAERFASLLNFKGRKVSVVAAPAESDVIFQRIKRIRIKDQLFIDRMQNHYLAFDDKFVPSYSEWQKAAFTESKARREAKQKAAGQAILGVLALVAGAVAAGSADGYNDPATYGAVSGVLVGAALLAQSFQTSKEAKFHTDALIELGQSIDLKLTPQVIKFEEESVELIGNAAEQYNQWRRLLQTIYAEQKTDSIQL